MPCKEKGEEPYTALIESWDNIQAMMEVDFELAQRLQTEEQGEITIEERSRLFVELMNKRKKHFSMLKVEEKRRKSPTKAHKKNLMSTYLKNMGGYKHNQLKSKSYEEIQKLFDNEMRRVNTFIPMDSEESKKAESSEEKAKGSRKKMLGKKREGKEKQQKSSKRQEEIKNEDIAIDAIPLATKPPMIVEYKLLKEGIMGIDREDLQTLWKLVKIKHGDTRPEDEHGRVLWGDLKEIVDVCEEFEPEPAKKKICSRSTRGVVIQDPPSAPKLEPAALKLKLKGETARLSSLKNKKLQILTLELVVPTPMLVTPLVAIVTSLLTPSSVSTIPHVPHQTKTPIPTPPITTDAPTITTAIPESDALTAVQLRVAKLEKDVSELKKIDLFTKDLATLMSQVPMVVDNYLGSKLGDALQKIIQKHSVLPAPGSSKI
ncbi:hypothetical protein Tco_1228652 [Tanacetum coccineum]